MEGEVMNEAAPKCPMGHDALLSRSLAEPEVLSKPTDYFRALREADPIHYDEKLNMYLVSRWEDLQTVFRDPVTFSQEKGWHQQFAIGHLDELKEILTRDGGGFFPEAILRDPPRHKRVRKLMEKAFTPERVAHIEPRIKAAIGRLIDKVADQGHADGFNDLAMPMAIAVMSEQLGVPYEDGKAIVGWTHAYLAQVGGMQTHEAMRANAKQICDLQNYVIARIRERQANRTEDMISDLIYARLEDEENESLTFAEIVALTRTLVVGGNDTTASAITSLLYTVATKPEVAAALEASVDDNIRMSRFIEELLRLEPPARALYRVTTKEVELGGKRIPEGAYVCTLFASGNDDESLFTCPRDFDMDRKNLGRHLSFGAGIHHCVGINLARMEIKVAAREIIKRLKDIKLAVPEDQLKKVLNLSFHSYESLPLTFARR
jgi:cytochrome P450